MAAKSRGSTSSSRSKSRSGKRDATQEEQIVDEPVTPQLAWKVLTQEQVSKLMKLSPKDLANEVAVILSLKEHEQNLREAALLDYYVTGIWFAHESSFNEEQTSAFFTILHILMDNIKDKHLSLPENIKQMRQIMRGVGVSQHNSLHCFSLEMAQQVIQYIAENLLQHYHLFQYLIDEDQEEETISNEVSVCIPPDSKLLHPAPLEEGVTEEFYNEFIASPPPSQQPSHSQQFIEIPLDELSSANRTKDNEVPSLSNINPEEVKTVLHKMATDTMSSYQAQIVQKLKDRETTYAAKLDKIAKSFRS